MARRPIQRHINFWARCLGNLLRPSPPAEKATASKDQAGQASTGHWAGNRRRVCDEQRPRWVAASSARASGEQRFRAALGQAIAAGGERIEAVEATVQLKRRTKLTR